MPTTIHSFPQELIRHTLSLAYPPGAYKFQQGLCLASLVHPSWTEPAVSLVTCIVNFQGDKPKAIQAFLESGPVGRRCHEVKLASVDDAMAQQVVAKFGGVERVHLQARSGSTFDLSVMLSSPACHCLHSLTISDPANYIISDSGSQWPTGLVNLKIMHTYCSPQVLVAAANTLTALHVSVPNSHLLQPFTSPTHVFSALTSFTLNAWGYGRPDSAQWPTVVDVINAMPHLAKLKLLRVSLERVQELLDHRSERASRIELTTTSLRDQSTPEELAETGFWDRMLQRLERVGRARGMASVSEWDVQFRGSGTNRAESNEWAEEHVTGWANWTREMDRKGLRLIVRVLCFDPFLEAMERVV